MAGAVSCRWTFRHTWPLVHQITSPGFWSIYNPSPFISPHYRGDSSMLLRYTHCTFHTGVHSACNDFHWAWWLTNVLSCTIYNVFTWCRNLVNVTVPALCINLTEEITDIILSNIHTFCRWLAMLPFCLRYIATSVFWCRMHWEADPEKVRIWGSGNRHILFQN